jgi:hypothetical protein
MIFKRQGLEIFIFREAIDMRFGFHRLTGLVRNGYGMQKLLDGHVFVFFGNYVKPIIMRSQLPNWPR